MTYRKKLIEVALPLEAINVASAREKSIRHGHPSTLHLWWARRPLAAARAVIFASLVDDPDSPDALPAFVEACNKLPIGANVKANGDTPRMRLFDFIERLVTWEATTDEAILNTARELIQIATEGNPPPLLDPFAGGGSIPLEAQRLGLEAHASDLNPVAVMINKAQIEIPPRFANMPPVNPRDREQIGKETWRGAAGLAADVRYYGEWMREKAWERIGHLYPTHNGETVIAWIWARTVKSPNPAVNAYVPLVNTFWLSKQKGKKAWVEPVIVPDADRVEFLVRQGEGQPSDGTVKRGVGRCLISGVPITKDYIKQEAQAGRMRSQLMAMVVDSRQGRIYLAPDKYHEETALKVEADWHPELALAQNPRHMTPTLYGQTTVADLFTERQLAALDTLCSLVNDAYEVVYKDALNAGQSDNKTPLKNSENAAMAYAEAIATYLGLTPSKAARFSSTQSFWRADEGKLSRGFGRQAVSITWDYAETNPFSGTGGDFEGLIEGTADVLEKLYPKSGEAFQFDAGSGVNPVGSTVVSTDPPYYDNVPYADISDIFYVWLRRGLNRLYPDLFGTMLVPKVAEIVADPIRHGGKDKANKFFEEGLHKTFSHIRQIQRIDYPLTVYYAFKQAEEDDKDEQSLVGTVSTGWETMLEGLLNSSFQITGTLPMHTEGPTRMRGIGANALASSIVLVCRPRPGDAPTISRRAFVDSLRRELPAALKEMQSGNIAPVDLAQASIGPGMAIYSRYSKVLEADGSPMSVRTALGLINQELDAYLAEQDGDIDADTRFAVSWFEQFGFNEGEFGQADVLARAKNTSVAGVEAARLVVAGRGKVKLLHWKEYDPGTWDPQQDKRPTVWEATHHLIERLNNHGETGSAMLMTRMPHDMAAEARNLAYRLYSICERKGWADHARDYNALVISWAGIGEEAARLKQAQEAGDATEQLGMFE